MEVIIRPIQENDFGEIVQLFKEFAHFEKLPEKMTNSVDQIKKEKDFFNCYVAILNEEIVGFASYFFAYYTWVGKALYLDDLYVKSDFRKQGIGKKLLNTVIEFAKAEKCNKMRWQVSNWNKNAQQFYKHIGAEIDDIELNCDLNLN